MSAEPTATDEPTIDARLRALEQEVQDLREEKRQQNERIDELEGELEQKGERIDELESELQRVDGIASGALNKASTNTDRVGELQARELEKGAHLLEENIPRGSSSEEAAYSVDVADGRLEKIQKENDETYLRMPETDDPLGRGGSTTLAHGDLLPIQQLAQMDEDMLQSATSDLPSELAAKLWKARDESHTGPNPWQKGSGKVREYVKSSDIKTWIYRQEGDIKEEYAKKLVSRTISRLLDYSNNKLAVQKKDQRKNGLTYKERFVEIRTDVPIPGETAEKDDDPETDGVLG
ncbi:hypothetical protein [Natrinema thermotolerans]|uniref:hypothetical protein n=1 Tax=Natrinema thermotolerans TaxID=121872 RepID=UPI000678E353|nr:hypothetical protein [Natrinema thermotolerans]QCC57339.1 hypothetical protein DVR14_01270 [Natrinema thermotolerans]